MLALLPSWAAAQEFFTLKGHGGPIMGIAASPTGQIATASFDNAVGVWTGQTPHWLEGHRAAVNTVAFWNDETLVSAGDDFEIRVWDTVNDQSTLIGHHKGKVVDLALSPETGRVASASWDGFIGLWSLNADGTNITGQPTSLLKGHDQGVNKVAFTRDGTTLYSASMDGTIRVWDIDRIKERQILVNHGFGINELVVNEDDTWLAYGAVDGVTRIIDLATGAEMHDFTLDRRPILALAMSQHGNFLAVGDGEGYIMVIDTRNWRIAHDFRATLRGPVWALAFSPDGSNIHAGGLDEAMYSWPVASLGNHTPMEGSEHSYLKDPSEMSNGERQFARKCSICHSLTPGSARRAGPTLHGLFGRAAGSVPDYTYSNRLSGSDIIWNADSINALFDLGPDHYIPGSKMPMQRITSPDDRADLITYMRQATAGEPTE
ncbi:MAG: c-type cytochrome [Sedimentitalea sp.]|uniref:c-type cytochrome n=1 Tax=Sedimentitalea sp. TaxID=2048915 RepID=UPI003266D7F5